MGPPDSMLSEVSHIQKDKYYMNSLICGIIEKDTTPVVTRGRGWRKGELEGDGQKV